MPRTHLTPLERFTAKYTRDADTGCWLWHGAADNHGYGRIKIDGVRILAHRFAYEAFVGPIPHGLEIDHLCRTPSCVNPAHLEPVTHRENMLRSNAPPAAQARQTHCIHGHEFTPENTYLYPPRKGGQPKRACRQCTRENHARYYRDKSKHHQTPMYKGQA